MGQGRRKEYLEAVSIVVNVQARGFNYQDSNSSSPAVMGKHLNLSLGFLLCKVEVIMPTLKAHVKTEGNDVKHLAGCLTHLWPKINKWY